MTIREVFDKTVHRITWTRLKRRAMTAVYNRAVTYFKRGHFSRGETMFLAYLRLVGHADLLQDRNTNGCPNSSNYQSFESEFARFIRQKEHDWETARALPPYFLRTGATCATSPTTLGQHRLLILVPQYLYNNDRFVECPLPDHAYETARNAGLDAEIFYTDRVSYPYLSNFDPDLAALDLQRLRSLVEQLRPDLILFDANYAGKEYSLNREYFATLTRDRPIKLVAFIGDAWGELWVPIADYWGEVVDHILHFAPGGSVEQLSRFKEKLVCLPYPVNRKNFFRQDWHTFDLSFFGSYSYLRPFWLIHARRTAERLGLRTVLRPHEQTNECPNVAEYAATMRNSRMILNFTSRGDNVRVMTGRVWQALASGCLLLEEDNEATPYFFAPFVHYIPFQNARQLDYLIEYFHKNPDQTERIGARAAAFCDEHYNERTIYSCLLAKAFSSAA